MYQRASFVEGVWDGDGVGKFAQPLADDKAMKKLLKVLASVATVKKQHLLVCQIVG